MDTSELVRVLYNVSHQLPLGANIALYFFLTGISAASFLISTMAYVFGMGRFKAAGRIGAWLAPIVLLIAPIFLLIDLEQPLRFVHLFWMWNWRSPISWGTALLTLYPINCLIYLYYIYRAERPAVAVAQTSPYARPPMAGGAVAAAHPADVSRMKLFGTLGVPLAIAVHGYTGFIVAMGIGRAMWNVSLMPIYFLLSAMVSGAALLILACIVKERLLGGSAFLNRYLAKVEDGVIRDLGKMLLGFVFLDLFLVLSEVLVLLSSRVDDQAAAALLMRGAFAPLFLGVEVALGLIVPAIILLIPRLGRSMAGLTVASVLVLIGVYAMRYVTVVGGQMIPLN